MFCISSEKLSNQLDIFLIRVCNANDVNIFIIVSNIPMIIPWKHSVQYHFRIYHAGDPGLGFITPLNLSSGFLALHIFPFDSKCPGSLPSGYLLHCSWQSVLH